MKTKTGDEVTGQAASAVADMSPRKTVFVSVNLTEAARDELRQVTLDLTTPADRRVSMSDVLLALVRSADRDRVIDELGKSQP